MRRKNQHLRKEIKREGVEQNDVVTGLQAKFKKTKQHLDTIQNYQVSGMCACSLHVREPKCHAYRSLFCLHDVTVHVV
jgi:hypothetical protein